MAMEINASYKYTQVSVTTTVTTDKADAAKEDATTTNTKQDGYVKSAEEKPVTYKPDMDKVRKMKAELSRNMTAFQTMVQGMVQKQAGGASFSLKDFFENIQVDEATRKAAEEAISDDGYWGVEATANRIVDFAKAISGGDPSKIDMLMKAVKKGFGAAEEAWGGKMPDITGKTYDRVVELFDEWKNPKTEETEEVSAE